MKRPLLLASLAMLLAVAGSAEARGHHRARAKSAPARAETTRFLGLDPHGPLAKVQSGTLAEPEAGACRTWGERRGAWKTLDSLGRVVGTAHVSGAERYDVTNCDELAMTRTSGKKGAGIFVRGKYTPAAIRAYQPSKPELERLEKLVGARDRKLPKAQSKKRDPAVASRMLAFQLDGQRPRVVVGGRALSVFRLDASGWVLEHEELPCDAKQTRAECAMSVWDPMIFRPVAALDMDGDGDAEIVVHEAWVDAYDDTTLTPDGKGGFKRIESGIHGAFA